MIPIEALKSVKHVISHSRCPDGIASALLILDVLPDAELRFFGYQTKELKELEALPNMLFCDIVPPEERAQEFIDAGAIVLDHHKGMEALIARFGERGVFADEKRDPGVSGATLAFEHVWWPLHRGYDGAYFPEAVDEAKELGTLVGIRDTWQKQSEFWESACNLNECLRFMPWDYWEAYLKRGGFGNESGWWSKQMDLGRIFRQRHLERVNEVVKHSRFWPSHKKTRIWIMPGGFHNEFASDASDMLGSLADLVVMFDHQWDGHQDLQLSLRSNGAFDCKAFCKEYGGGGHTNAAGCTVRDVGGGPYRYIQDAVDAFEAKQSQPLSEIL